MTHFWEKEEKPLLGVLQGVCSCSSGAERQHSLALSQLWEILSFLLVSPLGASA